MTNGVKEINELNPCPFCGGEARYIVHVDHSYLMPACTIECTKCRASICSVTAKDDTLSFIYEARKAWNVREDNDE